MATYRLYLLDAARAIICREDFEAERDVDAIRIARAVYSACADVCKGFDLWEGARRVPTRQSSQGWPVRLDSLIEEHQQIVIETEEGILQSGWRVAESRLLIYRLNEARRGRSAFGA